MKKRISILIIIMLVISLLGACSASDMNVESVPGDNNYQFATDQYGGITAENATDKEIDGSDSELNNNSDYADKKVIKTGSANIEVTNYKESYADLLALIGDNGYIENSNIWKTSRYVNGEKIMLTNAELTIRIKQEQFGMFAEELENIGLVVNNSFDAEDISYRYYDTEARIQLKQDEKARLEEYLTEIDDAKIYFEVQSRITEVIYDIEQLKGSMIKWDNQVAYSSYRITINEIAPDEELSISEPKGFFGKIWENIVDGVDFLGNAIVFFAGAIPAVLLIGLIVFFIIKLVTKKKKVK